VVWSPQVRRLAREGEGADVYVVGHQVVDEFLEFAGGRARPNTVRAYAHDLKAFFSVVAKDPVEVRAADVFGFVNAQHRARAGAENVVRISDGSSGLSNATVRRRLAAVSAFYGYLIARGDIGVETNPVPRDCPRVAIDATDADSRSCARCASSLASLSPKSSPR
jgi:integrase/recombinase XerD